MSIQQSPGQEADLDTTAVLRLRVVTDADPGALARILGRFQNLNVMPRRVLAEATSADTLHIAVDIVGLTAAHVSMIAAKVVQDPCVLNAYWHSL
jgi:hypothetical protein